MLEEANVYSFLALRGLNLFNEEIVSFYFVSTFSLIIGVP